MHIVQFHLKTKLVSHLGSFLAPRDHNSCTGSNDTPSFLSSLPGEMPELELQPEIHIKLFCSHLLSERPPVVLYSRLLEVTQN